MKKFIYFLLLMPLCLPVCGCGSDDSKIIRSDEPLPPTETELEMQSEGYEEAMRNL